jgi:hypothetical protein
MVFHRDYTLTSVRAEPTTTPTGEATHGGQPWYSMRPSQPRKDLYPVPVTRLSDNPREPNAG